MQIFPSFIEVKKEYPIETFFTTVQPCETVSDSNIVTVKYRQHNKVMTYLLVNRNSQKQTVLHDIEDKKSILGINDFINKYIRCYDPITAASSSSSLVNLSNLRRVERSYDYYKLVLTKTTYHPLFKISDSLFIFNHIKDSVYICLLNGELQRTFSIQHHKTKTGKNNYCLTAMKGTFTQHTGINLVSN